MWDDMNTKSFKAKNINDFNSIIVNYNSKITKIRKTNISHGLSPITDLNVYWIEDPVIFDSNLW